jgi:hypothetical protein
MRMTFLTREEIVGNLQHSMQSLMNQYDVEEIGVYEEEGAGDLYYMGYTIRKNGKVYMINTPYVKNDQNKLSQNSHVWTIQQEEGETKGYQSLDDVFNKINKENLQ